MNFSRDEEVRLIECVALHRELYDASHRDYKDGLVRDNVWEEIASELNGKTGDDCKRRWRSIRDTWKRLKRSGKLSNRPVTRRKRFWPLAAHLEFLNSYGTRRISQSTQSDIDDTPDKEDNPEDSMLLSEEDGSKDPVNAFKEETLEIFAGTEPSPSSGTSRRALKVFKRKDSEDQLKNLLKLPEQEADKLLEILCKGFHENNEIDMFYKSIALSVKRLPRRLAAEAKIRHLHILNDLEMQAAAGNTYQNTSDWVAMDDR